MVALTLPTSSNPGRYGHDGATRLINARMEPRGEEGKTPYGLYVSRGLKPFATLAGGGACRGFQVSGNFLYVNSGQQVFRVDSGGGAQAIGAFAGSGVTYMALNQKTTPQIMMVSSGIRAIIENDAVSPITDTDLQPPNSVSFLNQRFVATIDNGRFQWSALAEGTDWNSLDFVTAEYAADGLLRGVVRGTEFLAFGPDTIEPWYNPAAGNTTFARSGSVIKPGAKTGAGVALIDDLPIYVANDNTVRIIEGYQARAISNGAVERSIRKTTSPQSVEAFTYQWGDHSMYVVTGVDFTWEFDFRTGNWSERESYGLKRWRARCAVPFAGRIVVGDYQSNKLYTLDDDTYSEDGADLVMTVQFPVHAYPNRIRLDKLRIDTIPGQGTLSHDPVVMVTLSRDGGKTWGNEKSIPMGKAGQYFREVRLTRLGTSKEDGFVIRMRSSPAVVRAIMAADATYQVLNR